MPAEVGGLAKALIAANGRNSSSSSSTGLALQLQPTATDDDSGDDDNDGTTRLFDLQRVLREASLAWLQRYLGPPLGVTRCGYLLKRNPHGLWQARWFVLEAPEDSCELCYYRALLPPLLTVFVRSVSALILAGTHLVLYGI